MTELMKRYEAETGEKPKKKVLVMYSTKRNGWGRERNSFFFTNKFVAWLLSQLNKYQAKATAYDRLMSGNPTPKEIANVLNRIIAMDADFKWYAFGAIPYGKTKFRWVAVHGSTKYRVPCFNIKFDGDWKESLTMPDGWEEKK